MIEILAGLTPILLVDVVNPILFGFMVVAAGTSRPVLLSSSLLLGHTAAYVAAGIGLAMGLDTLIERLENQHDIDFLISLCLGLVCLALAIPAKQPAQKKTEEDVADITPLSALGWGAVVNFVGIPFALPYFAALSQITTAEISSAEALLVLLGYNLIYALPFAVVPLLVALSGDASQPILQRVNTFLDRISGILMPDMLGLLGLFLVADAVIYFRGGTPLF